MTPNISLPKFLSKLHRRMNYDHLRSFNGIFQLSQTIINIIIVSLISNYSFTKFGITFLDGYVKFLFLVSFMLSIVTALLLISSVFEEESASTVETLFVKLYHFVSCSLLLFASSGVLYNAVQLHKYYTNPTSKEVFPHVVEPVRAMIAASVFGLINSIIYWVNWFLQITKFAEDK